MRRGRRFLCLSGMLLLSAISIARADGLQILTTDAPPFAYLENGKLRGFCVDIVEELKLRLGVATPIQSLPWQRAYQAGLEEPRTILVCPKRTPERETLFKWVGPLATTTADFYALTASHLSIKSLDDGKSLSAILVPLGWYTAKFLTAKGFNNIEEVRNKQSILAMLQAGRAPVMLVEASQAAGMLKEAKLPDATLEKLLTVMTVESDLSFSKDFSDQEVARWQRALDVMRQDGSYAKIFARYFPAS